MSKTKLSEFQGQAPHKECEPSDPHRVPHLRTDIARGLTTAAVSEQHHKGLAHQLAQHWRSRLRQYHALPMIDY